MTISLRLARYRAAQEGPGGASAALVARLEADRAGYATPAKVGPSKALARGEAERLGAAKGDAVGASLTADHGRAITPKAASAKPPTPAPKPAAVLKPSPVKIAAAPALSPQHARIAAVYGSEHARGRESVCATLLANPKGWSAAEIIAQLPHLPTDLAVAVQNGNFGWDAIHAEIAERTGRASVQPKASNRGFAADQVNHGWAEIHAEIAERRGTAAH